jgi:hypothetical protein
LVIRPKKRGATMDGNRRVQSLGYAGKTNPEAGTPGDSKALDRSGEYADDKLRYVWLLLE